MKSKLLGKVNYFSEKVIQKGKYRPFKITLIDLLTAILNIDDSRKYNAKINGFH
jgi:hypothetical protein